MKTGSEWGQFPYPHVFLIFPSPLLMMSYIAYLNSMRSGLAMEISPPEIVFAIKEA
jgi:hypothetical protein